MAGVLLGFLLGTVVTLAAGFLFYWASGKDLSDEAKRLRKLSAMIAGGLQAMSHGHTPEWRFNSDGELVGQGVTIHAPTARAQASAIPPDDAP